MKRYNDWNLEEEKSKFFKIVKIIRTVSGIIGAFTLLYMLSVLFLIW